MSATVGTAPQTIVPVVGQSRNPLFRGIPLRNGPLFPPASALRIIVSGWVASGKTSILLSIPRCLIVDTERATEELPPPVHSSTQCVTVTRWEDWLEILKALRSDAETNGPRRTYDTVAIDTLSGLCGNSLSLASEFVLRESKASVLAQFGQKGAGWIRLQELATRYVALELESMGYGWIASCHLRSKQVDLQGGGSVIRTVRDITDSIDGWFRNRASYIAVVERTVRERQRMKTRMIEGQKIEVPDGEPELVSVYSVKFTTARDGEREETGKARLFPDAVFEFGPTDGWAQFLKRYEPAVAALRARVAAAATGKVGTAPSAVAAA